MVSIRFLSTALLLCQALAQPWDGLNPGDTVLTTRTDFWRHRTRSSWPPFVTHLNPNQKRQNTIDSSTTTTSTTTTSRATVTVISTTTSYFVTEYSTTTVTQGTTTPSTTPSTTTTTTTISSTTSSVACPTTTYVIQAAGTGDFAVDGNFAQLQSAFGSGYRVSLSANRQNAQQFHLGGPTCDTLFTADNNLQAMVGGDVPLHYVYVFPSTAAASAIVNVNWELLVCVMNADDTLSCTAMGQGIFQVTQGDPLLELGDQNYGEAVTLNLVPVPGGIF